MLNRRTFFFLRYMNGMLQPNGADEETNEMIEKATRNFLEEYDTNGVKNIADWEVDELIQWTNSLSYDE